MNEHDNGFQVVLNDTITPSPTWVINSFASYSRWQEAHIAQTYGTADASTIGLSPSLFQAPILPGITVENYAGLGMADLECDIAKRICPVEPGEQPIPERAEPANRKLAGTDQYLSLQSRLDTLVTNPFYGIANPNSYLGSQPAIPYNQLLRPYPEFTYMTLTRSLPGARSSYNAQSRVLERVQERAIYAVAI